MGPITHADGHDGPGSISELVPSLAAVVDDVIVGREDPVREPVGAHELFEALAILWHYQWPARERLRLSLMILCSVAQFSLQSCTVLGSSTSGARLHGDVRSRSNLDCRC